MKHIAFTHTFLARATHMAMIPQDESLGEAGVSPSNVYHNFPVR